LDWQMPRVIRFNRDIAHGTDQRGDERLGNGGYRASSALRIS
jgi:hypothetical protein